MSHPFELRAAPDYVTTTWSGGTTTQLLIAPADAVYADREFLWRISSATVELEESDFTPLPAYRRLIATLRGNIVLTHNDSAPVSLLPYEIHAFDGADRTHSVGKCTDFNLMLRKGNADGRMDAVCVQEEKRLIPEPCCAQQLLYCAEGSCFVSEHAVENCQGNAQVLLCAGQTLLVNGACPLSVIPQVGSASLMYCRMWRTEA